MTWAPDELLQSESSASPGIARPSPPARATLAIPISLQPAAYHTSRSGARAIQLTAPAVTWRARPRSKRSIWPPTAFAAARARRDIICLLAEAPATRARLALDEPRCFIARATSARRRSARTGRAPGRPVSTGAETVARYADDEVIARWQRWKPSHRWSAGRSPAVLVEKEATVTSTCGRGAKVYRPTWGSTGGDKLHAGDGATPEGRYRIVARKPGARRYTTRHFC